MANHHFGPSRSCGERRSQGESATDPILSSANPLRRNADRGDLLNLGGGERLRGGRRSERGGECENNSVSVCGEPKLRVAESAEARRPVLGFLCNWFLLHSHTAFLCRKKKKNPVPVTVTVTGERGYRKEKFELMGGPKTRKQASFRNPPSGQKLCRACAKKKRNKITGCSEVAVFLVYSRDEDEKVT